MMKRKSPLRQQTIDEDQLRQAVNSIWPENISSKNKFVIPVNRLVNSEIMKFIRIICRIHTL